MNRREIVHITQDDHPALPSRLEAEIAEEIAKQTQGLLVSKDWPDFEKRRGQILGLQTAAAICKNIISKLNA